MQSQHLDALRQLQSGLQELQAQPADLDLVEELRETLEEVAESRELLSDPLLTTLDRVLSRIANGETPPPYVLPELTRRLSDELAQRVNLFLRATSPRRRSTRSPSSPGYQRLRWLQPSPWRRAKSKSKPKSKPKRSPRARRRTRR